MGHREDLQRIHTFPQLIAFLRDEMDWPIESDDFEDLTFDYTPEELGIDSASAAKIQEIKRLRPLVDNQPWGIFFVKFEPKRLPVVALRRILGRVIVRKRASANPADSMAWATDDLLFVSNYGEGDQRQISFAHFSQESHSGLPTLRVLGWDNLDTPLHLDHVADQLTEKLAWPRFESDAERWREMWGSAFTLRPGEVIATSKALAGGLAELARAIRDRIKTVLAIETDSGPVTQLMKAFKEALVHDLEPADFADMYAQTVAYGLLSARIANPEAETADGFAGQLPIASPFLKELMETFLHVGGRSGGGAAASLIDFDELGVSEVMELLDSPKTNMEAVVRDFGDRNPLEDPVIHFYELFLKEYDPEEKLRRGVFYTPRPVVSYIVRSVDELLRSEFGLVDGLADITTWGEMAERHEGLAISNGVESTAPFVAILDLATGTGTFLVETIEVVHRTLVEKWKREGHGETEILDLWNHYVPKHLLPRLYGYELLMAPYAIAHLKIGLKLHETGYRFRPDDRVRVYLTNSLQLASDIGQQALSGMLPALAHEAQAVNDIKRNQRFTVVMGNPPYAGISSNMSDEIMQLVEPYKSIDGVSLGERKIWAQDDYKKFLRFAQLRIEDAGCGIVGLITNHGFVGEPTSRGLRHSLMGSYSRLSLVDLHGSLKKREVSPDGTPDKNVFDIEPGVAISLLRHDGATETDVRHADLWGSRQHKYDWLQGHSLATTDTLPVAALPEFFLFIPRSEEGAKEYLRWPRVTEVFRVGSNGIQTSRDDVVYGFADDECRARIADFRAPEETLSTTQLRDRFWPGKKVGDYLPGDTRGWKVPQARQSLRDDAKWERRVGRALYRPFDFRALFYADYMIDWPRTQVMQEILSGSISMCVGRAGAAADGQQWNVVFCSDCLVDMNLFYRGGNVCYPLWLAPETGGMALASQRIPNLKAPFLTSLSIALGAKQEGEHGLPKGTAPEDIFNYAYAVFHDPGYRARYSEFLEVDFAHLPLPGSQDLFWDLAVLGRELVETHLMEASALECAIATYAGQRNVEVRRAVWLDQTVWLDGVAPKRGQTARPGTSGFRNVPEAVWNFRVGGYQVCEKWLKDRKGRMLSEDDIAHYQRIVVAIAETIRIMGEIDEVIEEHGGWPGAFAPAAQA